MSAIASVLWPGMKALEATSQLGGILARKRGYHNSRDHLPMPGYTTDYSILLAADKEGPDDLGSAIDWTFPEAHNGDYSRISKYSKRLYAAGKANDPRTVYMREFFGNTDGDTEVEGWDFTKNQPASSDKSHLWHIHISIHRKWINSVVAMKAILSILSGESLGAWNERMAPPQMEAISGALPVLRFGMSDPIDASMWGHVGRAQKLLDVTPADGDYGPITQAAVKEYNAVRMKRTVDGKTIDVATWRHLIGLRPATLVPVPETKA